MKKIILLSLLALVLLTGCTRPRDLDSVLNEPNFAGIVEEVGENTILVRANEDEDEIRSSDLIYVSLDVEIEDSLTDFKIGDEVRVYYDGQIAESYPAQVHTVYAIVLVNGE